MVSKESRIGERRKGMKKEEVKRRKQRGRIEEYVKGKRDTEDKGKIRQGTRHTKITCCGTARKKNAHLNLT